ncbi:helix-turn-helix domain-containing protein [Allomesorhizobium alhagi]|uniref:helix-turn-helix domain-containing protein n=1 Tax=Allomesorhizobium alhagi TaxID=475067 RepID=UPI001300BF8D
MDRVVNSCLQVIEDVNRRRGGGLPVFDANTIRTLRSELGLSQRQFAGRYGFDLHVLKSWEAGRRSPDTANVLLLNLVALDPEGMANRIGRCLGAPIAGEQVAEFA